MNEKTGDEIEQLRLTITQLYRTSYICIKMNGNGLISDKKYRVTLNVRNEMIIRIQDLIQILKD